MQNFKAKNYFFTVSASKRLIGKSIVNLDQIKEALKNHTIVIIAGTTNYYVAQELLNLIDPDFSLDKYSFFY